MASSKGRAVVAALLLLMASAAHSQTASSDKRIILATTTSTEQSGLLAWMLPVFERRTGYTVDVIAVGTGASLKLGENGDCDVVLAHARALEDAFMARGFGAERLDVMYNDFVIVGPKADPVRLDDATDAAAAFRLILSYKSTFLSRGDNSGTNVKEKELWAEIGAIPLGLWYKEAGQGMSQVLIMADQLNAYTLADRATWLALKDKVGGLKIVFEGGTSLRNPYGIIKVNPAKWPKVNATGAQALVDFFTGAEGKALIQSFRIEGVQCFFL